MFQNAFQQGPFIEVFDPKVNKDKDKTIQNLYKANTPNQVNKIYDKDIKGYIFEIEGYSTKLRFPKDEKLELCLLQQFLVIQVYLPFNTQWNLELVITDTSKTKRRINLIPQFNKIEKKFFHVKVPNEMIRHGEWLNLSIDVQSFMEAWSGQTFRSLDSIIIGSQCKLRKIFTMKTPLFQFGDEEQIEQNFKIQPTDVPRQVNFPPGIIYSNQMVTYESIQAFVDIKSGLIPEKIQINDSLQHTEGNITDSMHSNVFGSNLMRQGINNKSGHQKQHNQKMEMNSPEGSEQKIQEGSLIGTNNSKLKVGVNNQKQQVYGRGKSKNKSQHDEDSQQNQNQEKVQRNSLTKNQRQQQNSNSQQHSNQKSVQRSSNFGKNRSNIEEDSQNNLVIQNQGLNGEKEKEMSITSGSESRKSQKTQFLNKQLQNSSKKERNSLSLNSNKNNPKGIFNLDKTPNKLRGDKLIQKDDSSTNSQVQSGAGSMTPTTVSSGQVKKKGLNSQQQVIQQTSGLRSPYTTNEQQQNPWKQNAFKKLNYQQQSKEVSENEEVIPKATQQTKQIQQQIKTKEKKQVNKQEQQTNQNNLEKRDIKTAQLNQNKKKFKPKGIQETGKNATPQGNENNKKQGAPIIYKEMGKEGLIRTGGDLRSTSDNDFFELSQKFQTISDPRVFQMSQNKFIPRPNDFNKNQQLSEKDDGEEDDYEIEENIEDESRASQVHSPKNNHKEKDKNKEKYNKNNNKRSNSKRTEQSSECAESYVISNSKLPNKEHNNSHLKESGMVDLQDSLEGPNFGHPLIQRKNDIDNLLNNRSSQANSEEDDENKEARQSFYDRHFTKYLNNNQRPFTPPFQSITPLQSSSLVTKKNKETVVIEKNRENNQKTDENQEDGNMLEVIYDPVLNCYYDPQTNSYYELKV